MAMSKSSKKVPKSSDGKNNSLKDETKILKSWYFER